MGVFNKLMDVFFEEQQGGAGPQNPGTGKLMSPSQMLRGGGTPPPSTPPASSGPVPTMTAISGSIDDKVYREFSESLMRELEAANLPGFDFYEFQMLYNRFKSEGQSEDAALKTAMASAETMRVDRNTLIAKHSHYVKVLNDQKSQFEQELKQFFEENIKGPRDRQNGIDTEVTNKSNQIQQLQQEIESLKEKKSQMGMNAVKAESQTKEVQAAFVKAFQEVSSDLTKLVEKLKQA